MKHAETVTFGGGGLDRAAQLRGDIDAHMQAGARMVVMWRGKPAFRRPAEATCAAPELVTVAPDHPALGDAVAAPVFLGQANGHSYFAQDISTWQPDGDLPDQAAFFDDSEQAHPALGKDTRFVELRGVMSALSPLDAELAATARSILSWHRSHGFCAACGAPSDVVQAGWQRSCSSCGTQHFPRTDPVVIMLITHGNSVLLGRSPGWPEGMYSLLAGFVEPGETIEAAVRREVEEEAGVKVGHVGYLASQPWPYPSSLMIGCRGDALGREITLDPAELEEALWATREEILQAFAGNHPVIRPARKGAIAHFLLKNWLADRLD